MKLSQGTPTPGNTLSESITSGIKKESKSTTATSGTDKLKASNFPASLLRIGDWEVFSLNFYDIVKT